MTLFLRGFISRDRQAGSLSSGAVLAVKFLAVKSLCSVVILISTCAALLVADAWAAGKESVTIGLPEFGQKTNYLKDEGLVSKFVRAAVSRALTTKSVAKGSEGALPYSLAIADNLSVSSDQKKWSFHLAKNLTFTNGANILASDVLYSLQECQRAGKLPSVATVKAREGEYEAGGAEQWVDIVLSEVPTDPYRLGSDLSDCPILERASSELFGEYLGEGTNLVGGGDFELESFKPQLEINMRRAASQPGNGGLSEFKLRGFRDPNQALAAIRIGTVDLFLTRDEEVLEKVRRDETLLVSSCLGYSLVKRKGLTVSCDKSLNPLSFKYES